jgi:hypothetical protein
MCAEIYKNQLDESHAGSLAAPVVEQHWSNFDAPDLASVRKLAALDVGCLPLSS